MVSFLESRDPATAEFEISLLLGRKVGIELMLKSSCFSTIILPEIRTSLRDINPTYCTTLFSISALVTDRSRLISALLDRAFISILSLSRVIFSMVPYDGFVGKYRVHWAHSQTLLISHFAPVKFRRSHSSLVTFFSFQLRRTRSRVMS